MSVTNKLPIRYFHQQYWNPPTILDLKFLNIFSAVCNRFIHIRSMYICPSMLDILTV